MGQYNLKSFFDNLTIHETSYSFRNVTFLPVELKTPPKLTYKSLKYVVSKGEAQVTEISEAGSVPEVKIINKSNEFILIPQGEHLEGAKQNRMVNTSILIEPNSEVIIPVSCIERGRWVHISPDFTPAEEMVAYKLRKVVDTDVAKNLKRQRGFRSDQSSVWYYIDKDFEKDGLHSETRSYSYYMKEKLNRERMYDFSSYELPSNINGVAVFINDKLISFEFFSDKNYFAEIKSRLLRAVFVEALDHPLKTNLQTDNKFIFMSKIGELLDLEQIHQKSIGVGEDFKILNENKNINASFLVHNDEVIHMVSFF